MSTQLYDLTHESTAILKMYKGGRLTNLKDSVPNHQMVRCLLDMEVLEYRNIGEPHQTFIHVKPFDFKRPDVFLNARVVNELLWTGSHSAEGLALLIKVPVTHILGVLKHLELSYIIEEV